RFEFLYPENGKVLAFLRTWEQERILVVANLSRFAQHAELNLPPELRGATPVELFGRTPFPPVGEGPYSLAMGPHTFYWFSLEAGAPAAVATREEPALPEVAWGGTLEDLLEEENREALERALPAILRTRSWFNPKRVVQWTEVRDVVPVEDSGFVVFVSVEFTEGEPETYLLTLAQLEGAAAEARLAQARPGVLARMRPLGPPAPAGAPPGGSLLVDALWERRFAEGLLALTGRRSARGTAGELEGWSTPEIRRWRPTGTGASAMYDRGAHTSLVFGTRFVMRVLRRIEDGPHPDVELGRTLTEARFPSTPPLMGALEYARSRTQSAVVGTLHGYVPHETDAWTFTLDELGRYCERVLTTVRGAAPPPLPEPVADPALREPPPEAQALIGTYLDAAALMGQRTADLHLALAAETSADFAPEPFSE
ncbi:MAG TPA: alpha-glucosidase C-terminal domain-containing protein, partial [Vicinamibacteria bacterium]|nr:alpha-glucosidase C-terminal domain-containing protein [Vicinamibacteria bacterium]